MMIIFLFWSLVLFSCVYAAVAGGKDGKWATAIIILASLLTIPASRMEQWGQGQIPVMLASYLTIPASKLEQWGQTQIPVMIVDAAALLAMYVLTLRSRAYWPIWMTAFQLVSVATHFATLASPSFAPRIYQGMESLWAIPGLLSMIVGIALDRGSLETTRRRRMPG
jgi:hypothetical protein